MKLIAGLIDLLFPPRLACPLCGSPQEDIGVCPGCLNKIAGYRREPVCFRCGRYFQRPPEAPVMDEAVLCRDCAVEGRFFQQARAAGPYQEELRDAVQRLKYTGRKGLAAHLSGLMFQAVENNPYYIMAQVIAPVPLSPERLRQRGFNQSELLAFGLAEKMKIPLLPVLRKIRETPPQTGLDRAGREANLAGAFRIGDPGAVRGKTVLVVDDVVTTGSTLNNVSETLVRGGAATVICIAAAAGRTFPAAVPAGAGSKK
ncbi:MAG: double zinc ribbon domain-containing protein [Peptococcaceae bacterium]|nr:double zinc ribbon domain-containing protein [Peptococcaceae bacterium]